MRKWFYLFFAAVFFLGCVNFAWSEPPMEPMPMGGPDGATVKEMNAMRKIRDKYQDKRDEITLNMEEKKLELIKLLKQSKPNKWQIKKKLAEIVELEKSRQNLMVDEFFEVRSQLSPTQAIRFTHKLILLILQGVERKANEF